MFAEVLHNEKELLILIGEGDETAFTTLFHHYRDKIYTVAFKLSGSPTLAEEAVQDVFVKIWLKRTDLVQVQNFKAYLYTTVQNTMYKTLKRLALNHKKMVMVGAEQAPFADDPELQLMQKDFHSILQNAIEKLPNQQKQVYKLVREKGLKRAEVANLLNLRPETVKFHLSKAVKNLRSYCQIHLHLFIGFSLTAFLLGLLLF